MKKILVVAEKPSVARDYARVLGCDQKRQGYLEGKQYCITWAIGHLISLAEPEVYDNKYKIWKFEDLPIVPERFKTKIVRKTNQQYQIVKKLMNDEKIESIICGTDSGREGELIFRLIYIQARCRKPFKRLWVSSLTDESIQTGFQQVKEGNEYETLYHSARCRAEADWLVGMNASRAYSIQYHTPLSIGRVQTPTLAMVVERKRKIDAFEPQTYWELIGKIGEFEGKWIDKDNKTRINSLEQAAALEQKIKGQDGVISQSTKKDKKINPPLFYDLTSLQKDANKRYGYSAKKVLQIAQRLYENKKMITYPRTDSRYVTRDLVPIMDALFYDLIKENKKNAIFFHNEGKEEKYALSKKVINDKKVTDHHAIIPTRHWRKMKGLTSEEKKVYDLILQRFMVNYFSAYQYQDIQVIVEVKDERVKVNGRKEINRGWKILEEKRDEQRVPDFSEGEVVRIDFTKILEKQTTPPKAYTDATLLTAMEKLGLGTPATRAAIIERLLTVGYLIREQKNFYPTEKGSLFIQIIPGELKSPEMTGKWEKGLEKIKNGKMHPQTFMNSIHRYIQFIIEQASEKNGQITFKQETQKKRKTKNGKRASSMGKCPICNTGAVLENKKAFYCSKWKEGCKFTLWKNVLEPYGISLKPTMVQKLLKVNAMKEQPLTLPQTQEKCTATIYLNEKKEVEVKDVKRI